jgi:ribosomal protein S18
MVTTTVVVPPELLDKIREFLSSDKTGNVTMDIKEGRILSWKITEHGRVQARNLTHHNGVT